MGVNDENASDELIVGAIGGLLLKISRLEDQVKQTPQNQQIGDLEKDKAEYQLLFKSNGFVELKASNPEKFKRLFKAEFGVEPVNETIKKDVAPIKKTEGYKNIKEDVEEYDELFFDGKLGDLKAKNPEKFRRLFISKYGSEPTETY